MIRNGANAEEVTTGCGFGDTTETNNGIPPIDLTEEEQKALQEVMGKLPGSLEESQAMQKRAAELIAEFHAKRKPAASVIDDAIEQLKQEPKPRSARGQS